MRVHELIAALAALPAQAIVLTYDERTGFPEPVHTLTLEPADPAHGLDEVVVIETREPT